MKKVKDFKAVTLYFSGVCNLNCSYCFQPKIKGHMGGVNKEILEWITSGKMEKDVEEIFGNEIETFALWGGEPTVNFKAIADRLTIMKERFPNFREISFSTNISTKKVANDIIYLAEKSNEIYKQYNDFKLDIQFSLDGPSDFNDCARIGSYSDEIVENMSYVFENLKGLEIIENIEFNAKSTHSKDNIQKLSNFDNLFNYFKFFDDSYEKWSNIIDNYPKGGHSITLVSPGNYTKEDGVAYLNILENIEKLKTMNWKKIDNFSGQLENRVFETMNNLIRKKFRHFSGEFIGSYNCGAGDGFLGLSHDGKIHVCQSSFFLDEKAIDVIKTKKLVTDFEENQGYSFTNYDKFIKDTAVINYKKEYLSSIRLLNNIEKYRNGIAFRIQYFKSMIPILVANGDILEKYSNEKDKEILAMFSMMSGVVCPSSNIWEYGSFWVNNLSYVKLLGNGALDFILESIARG